MDGTWFESRSARSSSRLPPARQDRFGDRVRVYLVNQCRLQYLHGPRVDSTLTVLVEASVRFLRETTPSLMIPVWEGDLGDA